MKKLLTRSGLFAGTIGLIVAGAAAFSAFEAHVVNVTASIENALVVPQEASGISFGTIFPEEVVHRNLDVTLSDSFQTAPRVDDIEYMIRQKPKCGIPGTEPGTYTGFPQVTEDGNTFVCPQGSVMLPLLCPYLSKHEITTDGREDENDIQKSDILPFVSNGINAFHGPLTNWGLADTIATQVTGRLVKGAGDTSDQWDLDLHAPCFKGQCAQDNVIPTNYQPDAGLEGQMFGCDLWLEVTGISLNDGGPGTLVVNKVIVNDNGGVVTDPSAFSYTINAGPSISFEVDGSNATSVPAGVYTVVENTPVGYTPQYNNCNSVVVNSGGTATCTITNNDNAPDNGTLTVHKIVVGSDASPSSFALFVDGSSVTNDVATTTVAGNHTVTETPVQGFVTTFSGDCNASGVVAVPANGSATCNVTNTIPEGTITVIKEVINHVPGTNTQASDFQMKIDNVDVAQNVSNPVIAGAHTISESGPAGYTTTFSGDCNGTNQVIVGSNENKTCTVTNEQQFGTITVTKSVINNDGGNKVIGNFGLKVNATTVTSGVPTNFALGTYTISETGAIGYAATFSGDCNNGGHTVTIASGDSKICGITNDDIAPVISLIKNVVNDNGGASQPNDFFMRVDGTSVPDNSSIQVTANTNHSITEDAFSGYHFVSMSGIGCPATLPGTVNLSPGASIECTITNSDDGGTQ